MAPQVQAGGWTLSYLTPLAVSNPLSDLPSNTVLILHYSHCLYLNRRPVRDLHSTMFPRRQNARRASLDAFRYQL